MEVDRSKKVLFVKKMIKEIIERKEQTKGSISN